MGGGTETEKEKKSTVSVFVCQDQYQKCCCAFILHEHQEQVARLSFSSAVLQNCETTGNTGQTGDNNLWLTREENRRN